MNRRDRKVICLTPVKNEAWILDTFLQSTSLWADYIIVADQGSDDGSIEIAKKYSKVILVENRNQNYNEVERQKLLIREARKINGNNNIFIALDADEILVNFQDVNNWDKIFSAKPGTSIWFPWLNVLPENKTYYTFDPSKIFGTVDDGREHKGQIIHSTRVPYNTGDDVLKIDDFKILHFQFSYTERLRSKHRWYECLEKIKFPDKSNVDIFRLYHHIDLEKENVQPITESWLSPLSENSISINVKDDDYHWWDKEVCKLFEEHGSKRFRKQYIWYVDWSSISKKYYPNNDIRIKDPRNVLDKWIHNWLYKSQKNKYSFVNRNIEKLVRFIKW